MERGEREGERGGERESMMYAMPYSGSSLSNAFREGGDTNAPCPSTLPTIEQSK